jgi:hypothetical protein
MDHEARFSAYAGRIEAILDALRGLHGFEAYRITERETPRPVVRDGVRIHPHPGGKSAQQIIEAMRAGDPCIWVREDDDLPGTVNVSVAFCTDEEAAVIARRLRDVLGA